MEYHTPLQGLKGVLKEILKEYPKSENSWSTVFLELSAKSLGVHESNCFRINDASFGRSSTDTRWPLARKVARKFFFCLHSGLSAALKTRLGIDFNEKLLTFLLGSTKSRENLVNQKRQWCAL